METMKPRFFLKKAIIFGLVCVFSGILSGAGADPSVLAKIKASGKLVVGTSADYPPYEFHLLGEEENGLVGIDIDIARVIARELGVRLEIKDLIFSRIFKALEQGMVDIAIAGIHPTEERRKIVAFSDVYYQAIQSIIIRTVDSDLVKTIEDLRGKRVGVQRDTIQEDMARSHVTGAVIVVRETIEELVIGLRKGLLDAVILEKPVAESYARRTKKFTTIRCEGFDSILGSAIAVRKGENELLKVINRILARLKKENKIDEFVENARLLTNKR